MHYIKYKEIKHHGTADFPAGYYHVTESHPQYAMPYHWHEELELIHIISGTFHVTINETTRNAVPGDILLVNSGGLHGGTPYDCVYECLVFPVSLLSSQTYASEFLNRLDRQDLILDEYFPAGEDTAIHSLLEQLFALMQDSDEGGKLQSLGLLYQFMGLLLQDRRYTASDKSNLSTHRNIYLLKNVLNYIEAHYTEKITLHELARTAGMSSKYFCHFFSEMTGRTPIDYVNYYRVERACCLLAGMGHSITDIAMLCGFNDVSYFTRTFKKYKGISPGQYLKIPLTH
ncbi:AraC family transcriptional regulator [Hungatella hathewayi]|uniref:helix-turn-helix transcriptional regulator n=1 Tax=Hungatella hathewayi TaxID=154046 RepID=UPI002108A5C8|nr:AraC family transcriptional regulator [Hungatella hathewayi]MCQ5387073.1 AraC family transcriptional regulator [Hungatella hathewayi]